MKSIYTEIEQERKVLLSKSRIESESRAERYDKQLKEEIGIDPEEKATEAKIDILRKYREDRYTKLQGAVYKARGWNDKGCPTVEKIKELGIDFEDVMAVISPHQ
ncbi:MAG: hypothetical protein ACXAEU_01010 [Candidatus Hodarchaeales archaeon]